MHFSKIHEHVQRHISMIEHGIFGKHGVVVGGQGAGCGHSGRLNCKLVETIDEDSGIPLIYRRSQGREHTVIRRVKL